VIAAAGAPVVAALVEALAPRPEDTVLELAAGTGEAGRALVARVGRLISSDLSPAMVEIARRRLPEAEHRVIDMHAIDLPDASVDGVLCRWGYMLVEDPALAVRETRRVLRPGGRLACAVWAAAGQNPWVTVFGRSLVARGLMEPPAPGEPHMFALGEEGRLETLLRTSFDDVQVEAIPVEFRYGSFDEYRRVMTNLGATLRKTLAGLDEGTRKEVEAEAEATLEPFARNGGYAVPGVSLVAAAR
jgi:ubiquinone/menaquinone biosynthesis C-methylase UbiE